MIICVLFSAAGQNQLASSEEEEIPDREANNATEETATGEGFSMLSKAFEWCLYGFQCF